MSLRFRDNGCRLLKSSPFTVRGARRRLITYLNDHLAGSVAALELVDHLIETYKGKPLERFFKDLRNEIDAEQCDRVDAKRLEIERKIYSSA